ncbi:MAG: helix-turn-helix transcriptional regulator [Lachnospiraceae bacterium]|nr:helix-turn-helix transcriptional regulator [Lachnospiraceae bacterium]
MFSRIKFLLLSSRISRPVCSAPDLERTNLNRYNRDEFQHIDANLILKLCEYFDCTVGDLFEIRER